MKKFQNKYQIKSTRLPNWDYGANGYYFVTICTKNKIHWFGEVMNRCRDAKSCVSTENAPNIKLSPVGKIAKACLQEIPVHFPFVELDEYVIMPNHVHGIVLIDKPDDDRSSNICAETQNCASLQTTQNRFGPQSKNLASIIRGYKAGVLKPARKIEPDFSWQPRFHDHVIRNENALNSIRNYIHFNVEKWEYDRENQNDIPLAVKQKAWKNIEAAILT